jgi:syndecan 4
MCFCDPGFGGHDCSVTAKCTADCYGHGICKFGKCFCDPGFAGEDCGTAAKCPNQCSDKGLCIYGKCFCQPDYEGEDCGKAPSCPTGGADDKHCSGHGICYQGTCYCDSKFAGENCAIDTTVEVKVGGDKKSNPFSGLSATDAKNLEKVVAVKQNVNGSAAGSDNATAAANISVVPRAAGANTQASMMMADAAEKSCGSNGYFHFEKNTCQCYPGYTGTRCNEELTCKNSCSKNGDCAYGRCFCHPGFLGSDCSEKTAAPVAAASVAAPTMKAAAINVEPKAAKAEDDHFLHMSMTTIIGICLGCAVVGAALGVAVREVQQRRKAAAAYSVLYAGEA